MRTVSDTHRLLCRLGEWMLDKRERRLPLDLLFDDVEIGPFVRSIQIDSPYQRLVLEGVLSEHIDEKGISVSFTVQGFGHHVLGEVIHARAAGQGGAHFKALLEDASFPDLEAGIQQALTRDAQEMRFDRIMWLIDAGENTMQLCIPALAQAFQQFQGHPKNAEADQQAREQHVQYLMTLLFEDKTDLDIEALRLTLTHLETAQKRPLTRAIYRHLASTTSARNMAEGTLHLRALEHLPKTVRLAKLDELNRLERPQGQGGRQRFLNALQLANGRLNQHDMALALGEEVLADRIHRFGSNHPQTATTHNNLGMTLKQLGNANAALDQFKKALTSFDSNHGSRHRLTATTLMNMGSACGDLGQHDAAEEHLEQALSIFQDRLGSTHTTTALCLNNLAVHHMRRASPSQYVKAVQCLETCLNIQLKVFGEHHPDVVRSHHNLGSCWTKLDNTEKAEHHLRQALDVGLVVHGEEHVAIGFIRSAYGALLMTLDRFEEALNEYNQSLAIRQARYPSNHPAVAIGLSKLGDAQLALARTEEARTSYRASHAIFLEKFGVDHANTRLISDKLSALS